MFFTVQAAARDSEADDLWNSVNSAKREMRIAANHFNELTEPGQIDEVIYRWMSAEKRVTNLLNAASQ